LDRRFPDKAIDVLDETGAFLRMRAERGETPIAVQRQDIERVIADMAKIPEESVSADDLELLKHLDEKLKETVYGQDAAVDTVVSAIRASRAGLNDADKPVASLLFVGPTGVGKTEIAKQLANSMNLKLIRFDMSEYQEGHAVARLIGAPPGYVGYEEGGLMTEAVRKTPHCVLLLDEIEKAHRDILNVLLQVMDYGSLTDNIGKKADFHNAILIMTSNAGARDIGKKIIGFDEHTVNVSAIDKEVERVFSPEFRNRLDEIVVFNHVGRQMARLITAKAIGKLAERLKNKDITLHPTTAAIDWIAEKGLSEKYGAREIIRMVDKELKKMLVDHVLFGKIPKNKKIAVDVKNNQLKLGAYRAVKK
jgi:ATP-dependent Clp protease ATP-binding subunit ClpA